jgi:hypothetical protein
MNNEGCTITWKTKIKTHYVELVCFLKPPPREDKIRTNVKGKGSGDGKQQAYSSF